MVANYFHHLFLNFPIALLVTAAGLLILDRIFKVWWMRAIGGGCLVLGAIAGIATGAVGLLASDAAESIGISHDEIHEHRNAALIGVGLSILAAILWLLGRRREPGFLYTVAIAAAVSAAVVVGYAAHQGGTMLHPRFHLDRVFGDAGEPRTADSEHAHRGQTPQPKSFDEQVERGRSLYTEHCARCHGDDAQGSERVPALVGPGALPATRPKRDVTFKTALDVLVYTEDNMPADDPGTLRADQYQAIIAWVLDQNGLQPLINRETADGIELHPQPSTASN